MSNILEFIGVFRSPSNTVLFTETACYWFARVLYERFPGSTIMYDPHQVHFATKIQGKVYDITGIVDDRDYIEWDYYKSYADDADLIITNCIYLKGGDS